MPVDDVASTGATMSAGVAAASAAPTVSAAPTTIATGATSMRTEPHRDGCRRRELIILCPLEHEATLLERALRKRWREGTSPIEPPQPRERKNGRSRTMSAAAEPDGCLIGTAPQPHERPDAWRTRMYVCGPGGLYLPERLRCGTPGPHAPLMVLAGLAGGLKTEMRAGVAVRVDAVIANDDVHDARDDRDQRGRASPTATKRVTSPAPRVDPAPAEDTRSCAPAVTVVSTRQVMAHSQAKRALARRHPDADLVDLESAAFLQWIDRLEIHTSMIIRGVSDDLNLSLPPEVANWVDDRGRLRPGRAFACVLRRPWIIPRLLRLSRNSSRAMRAVADLLIAEVAAIDATPIS